jgi:hypothetical protein
MPFGSAGYEIRNKAVQPVAAVSLTDRRVVYLMDVSPRERLLMATLCDFAVAGRSIVKESRG